MRFPRGLARRAGWGLGDQAFSSLTNVTLGIVVARSVSPAEFGAYSLAFATYLLIMGVVRAVSSQPLVIRYTPSKRTSGAMVCGAAPPSHSASVSSLECCLSG